LADQLSKGKWIKPDHYRPSGYAERVIVVPVSGLDRNGTHIFDTTQPIY
jgi:hypothetical protein